MRPAVRPGADPRAPQPNRRPEGSMPAGSSAGHGARNLGPVDLLGISLQSFLFLLTLALVALPGAGSGGTSVAPAIHLLLVTLGFSLVIVTYLVGDRGRLLCLAIRLVVFFFTCLNFMQGSAVFLLLYVTPLCFDIFFLCTARRRVLLVGILVAGSAYGAFDLAVLNRAELGVNVQGILAVIAAGAASSLLGLFGGRIVRSTDALVEENEYLRTTVAFLTRTSSQYLKYASLSEKRARKKERDAITRELHDAVGYSLTNIIGLMDHALVRPPVGEDTLRDVFRLVRDTAARGLSEVRTIIYRLRSIAERVEGIRAVADLIRTFADATHLQVKVEYGNCPNDLGSRLNGIVLRVIQESLVNSFRHGRATVISVYFWVDAGTLRLIIQDNGRAQGVGEKGIGQTGMGERVRSVGGSITFENLREGYRVIATLPVKSGRKRSPVAAYTPG